MILIYSEIISPRLKYISHLIFKEILGTDCMLTDDTAEFLASEAARLNYSSGRFGSEPFIRASSLLFMEGISMPPEELVEAEGGSGFFATSNDSLLPFDPLASAFLVVSRLEEYLPGRRDSHGRYYAASSVLYRYGLLEKPVVNLWADMLALKLLEAGQPVTLRDKSFRFISTIDIDNGFAYRSKSLMRTTGGLFKCAVNLDFRDLAKRAAVLFRLKPDPFDTYDSLIKFFRKHEHHVLFFVLLRNKGPYDRQVVWNNRTFRKRLQQLSACFRLGIHPSYYSSLSDDSVRVAEEKSRLEQITGEPVVCSRQHFLRLEFPQTYRRLLEAGIKEDYSMGYADRAGFRAGIATPFRFYDVLDEKETSLTVFPFQVMDVTLRDYMKLSPDAAIILTNKLIDRIKATGGVFSCIWHNESVNASGKWSEFYPVFKFMNEKAFLYAEHQSDTTPDY